MKKHFQLSTCNFQLLTLTLLVAVSALLVACTDDDTSYDDLTTVTEEVNLTDYFAVFSPIVGTSTATRGSYTNEDNNLRQFGLACRGSLDFDTVTVTLTPLIDIYIELKYAYALIANKLYDSDTTSVWMHSHYSRDSIWWPDTLMRWESKVEQEESLEYIAISPYPYRGQKDFLKFDNLGTIDVGVESDQKTYSDASNDLLLFRDTVNVFNELTDYGEIPVTFRHLLSKFRVEVIMDTTYNTQFAYETDEMVATENDIEEGKDTIMLYSDNYPNGRVLLTTRYNPISNIEISGFKTTGTLDLSVAQPKVEVTTSGTATTIYPGEDTLSYDEPFMYNDTARAYYEAVVVPQTVSNIGITFEIGSYTYSYAIESEITFEPGYNYSVTLPVGPEVSATTEETTEDETTTEAKGNNKLREERREKREESLCKVKVSLSPSAIKATKW